MFKREPKYKRKEVEYMLREVLRETVDRNTIKRMMDELRGDIGRGRINKLLQAMNEHEEDFDKKRFEHYISYLEELRQAQLW